MNKSDIYLAQQIWDYMRLEHPLGKADFIIGLGSSDTRTASECARLYIDGWAPKIIFTGNRGKISRDTLTKTEAETYAEIATQAGVPLVDILIEDQATNTGENVIFSHAIAQQHSLGVRTVMLVTKPYMLRRAYATFMKKWSLQSTKFICRTLPLTMQEYSKDPRYPLQYMVNVMVGDLQRIKLYPGKGLQISQSIPDHVWGAYETLVSRGYNKHLLQDEK